MAANSGAQAGQPQQYSLHGPDESPAGSEGGLQTFNLDWSSHSTPPGQVVDNSPGGSEGDLQSFQSCLHWPSHPPGQVLELRVRVVSASELQRPSYKLGDITSEVLGGHGALLKSVYAVLQLGDSTQETRSAENVDGRDAVSFEGRGGLMLFQYAGEAELRVELRDRRGLTSWIGGDPVIGQVVLPLDGGILDRQPRERDLLLERDGLTTGTVALQYQLLAVQGLGAAPPG